MDNKAAVHKTYIKTKYYNNNSNNKSTVTRTSTCPWVDSRRKQEDVDERWRLAGLPGSATQECALSVVAFAS